MLIRGDRHRTSEPTVCCGGVRAGLPVGRSTEPLKCPRREGSGTWLADQAGGHVGCGPQNSVPPCSAGRPPYPRVGPHLPGCCPCRFACPAGNTGSGTHTRCLPLAAVQSSLTLPYFFRSGGICRCRRHFSCIYSFF